MSDLTPVIVGVGEASERIDATDYKAMSPVELAAAAARAALDDALSVAALTPHLDVVVGIPQFEISGPQAVAPFGRADNFPRAVANRLGANPARAILEPVGGQGPQHLVNEFAQAIAKGETGMALFFGSEAISTVRHLMGKGEKRDWSETVEGQMEFRGYGLDGLVTMDLAGHGARTPIQLYALFENARRAKTGLSREAYALEMGKLFAPFTQVASTNPHAMSQEVFDAEGLATVTPKNRIVADPFPRRMIARDQANQGAAVLMTSVAKARELGIPEDRWVYLHGGADVAERTPIERQDLAAYPAAALASRTALERAGLSAKDIDVFDLYSCFPIAVTNVRDDLGVAADDPRPLTVTGGLPFFGGAGNNYSMHAIASMMRTLRSKPGQFGFVGANGGFLSKYSVGVYSTKPAAWKGFESKSLQAQIDAWPKPAMAASPTEGTVVTYTIDYGRDPAHAVLVCNTDAGERFVAMTDPAEAGVLETMIAAEPLGARVKVRQDDRGRNVVTAITPKG